MAPKNFEELKTKNPAYKEYLEDSNLFSTTAGELWTDSDSVKHISSTQFAGLYIECQITFLSKLIESENLFRFITLKKEDFEKIWPDTSFYKNRKNRTTAIKTVLRYMLTCNDSLKIKPYNINSVNSLPKTSPLFKKLEETFTPLLTRYRRWASGQRVSNKNQVTELIPEPRYAGSMKVHSLYLSHDGQNGYDSAPAEARKSPWYAKAIGMSGSSSSMTATIETDQKKFLTDIDLSSIFPDIVKKISEQVEQEQQKTLPDGKTVRVVPSQIFTSASNFIFIKKIHVIKEKKILINKITAFGSDGTYYSEDDPFSHHSQDFIKDKISNIQKEIDNESIVIDCILSLLKDISELPTEEAKQEVVQCTPQALFEILFSYLAPYESAMESDSPLPPFNNTITSLHETVVLNKLKTDQLDSEFKEHKTTLIIPILTQTMETIKTVSIRTITNTESLKSLIKVIDNIKKFLNSFDFEEDAKKILFSGYPPVYMISLPSRGFEGFGLDESKIIETWLTEIKPIGYNFVKANCCHSVYKCL